jgi:DNA-binding SARP family transcriptional activator
MERAPKIGHFRRIADPLDRVQVTVTLLGPFTIGHDGRSAGPWSRPPAKRLCELLMLAPDHRLPREALQEMLFSQLAPRASAKALTRAISLARQAVQPLGAVGPRLLRADRDHISVPAEIPLEIDLERHQAALGYALAMRPGVARDGALLAALLDDGVVLADEPYCDWALEPRDALEVLRQRARLELARDRTKGYGQSHLDAVIEAWEICLRHDPASEESAMALMRAYASRGERQLVVRTYRRSRVGLAELGLEPSTIMEHLYQSATDGVARPSPASYMSFSRGRASRRSLDALKRDRRRRPAPAFVGERGLRRAPRR